MSLKAKREELLIKKAGGHFARMQILKEEWWNYRQQASRLLWEANQGAIDTPEDNDSTLALIMHMATNVVSLEAKFLSRVLWHQRRYERLIQKLHKSAIIEDISEETSV